MLADVTHGCPAWFNLHPHSFLNTNGVLEVLGRRDNINILAIDPSYWELTCSEFSDIFEKPGPHLERAMKHKTNLLPDSVPPAKK